MNNPSNGAFLHCLLSQRNEKRMENQQIYIDRNGSPVPPASLVKGVLCYFISSFYRVYTNIAYLAQAWYRFLRYTN